MALPKPRSGYLLEDAFRTQPRLSLESTLADPEKIIWSSINQLTAHDIADSILFHNHEISRKPIRKKVSGHLGVYIRQAYAFYRAGEEASTKTSPLLYYYSFLNLAKALGSTRYPEFHTRPENYNHGVSWRPNPKYVVKPWREVINVLTSKGVWQILWEVTTGLQYRAKSRLRLRVKDLFALCPEISIEYERSFSTDTRLVRLYEPGVFIDSNRREVWLAFSVSKEDLAKRGISRDNFVKNVSHYGQTYRTVRASRQGFWTFELVRSRKYKRPDNFVSYFTREFRALNLFTTIEAGEIVYFVPYQRGIPRDLPQIVVLYSLMFWFGSLVRYDPHSIEALQESRWWVLLDGFMDQSRIWLLELFEWYLYRTETRLQSSR